jgi:uncharacterized protein YwqG
MDKKEKTFEIIRFTAENKRYFPASMKTQKWMKNWMKKYNYVKHDKMNIPLGKSRYGGCVFDLPKGMQHPENMQFAGQLDLSEFSPFDKSGLLPKTGQLIFFANIMEGTGKVIYADVENNVLERHILMHEEDFWDGILIDKIYAETETLSERFIEPEDEEDKQYANKEGKLWGWFEGSEKSKMFGIFTNCQLHEEEIEKISFSEKIVLLQIGEEGFNDEGVFSVLIDKADLKNRNFENCEFIWAQS